MCRRANNDNKRINVKCADIECDKNKRMLKKRKSIVS